MDSGGAGILADRMLTRLAAFQIHLDGDRIRQYLREAHIPCMAEDYVKTALTNLVCLSLMYIGLFFGSGYIGLSLPGLFNLEYLVFWLLLFFLMVPVPYLAQIYYPMLLAQGRKTRIELDLPYAVSYMQALSTTMTGLAVIRRIYQEPDMFGEVAKEFGMIVRDVDLFGEDLITAMRNLQHVTPSPVFRDFLNDLAIVFESGGDITGYLAARSAFFRDKAVQEVELILKTIEIMAEVYVAAFVAGPIAMIIMLVAQGMTGQSQMDWMMPLLYVGIPAGAIAMIWILSIMLPPENLSISRREVIEYDFSGGKTSPGSQGNEHSAAFEKDLVQKKKEFRIRQKLRHPFRTYISDYRYSVAAGCMCAGITTLFWFTGLLPQIFPKYSLEASLAMVIVAMMIPVAISYEGRRWYVRNVESHIPEFLRELADMKDIGITLHESIHRISSAKLGLLSSELSVASRDIQTGAYVSTALVRMEQRIGLVSVKRAISLLVKASEITAYLRDIFSIAIADFEHYLKLKHSRENATIVYVMIIYLSVGIYLYTAYQLNGPFISAFKSSNLNVNFTSSTGDMLNLGLILAGFSGVMAGQFSANSILCGLKHSIVLIIATVVMFVFIM